MTITNYWLLYIIRSLSYRLRLLLSQATKLCSDKYAIQLKYVQ